MKYRVALLILVCSVSDVAADPRDSVLAAWEASRNRVVTVRYTLKGAHEAKGDASGGGKNPTPLPKDAAPPFRAVILLDLPRRRHRLEETVPTLSSQDKSKYTTRSRVNVFGDGVAKSHHPRDKNEWSEGRPDMHIARGDLRTVHIAARYHALFVSHGFIPSSRDIPSPGGWPVPVERDEFEVQGTGILGGRAHTILRGESFHGMREEYWADLGRGGAVGRMVTWLDKTDPYMKHDIDYQEVGGLWVPRRWTHTVSRQNRILQVERIEVERVEVNPAVADGDFDIPVEPGYIVEEHTYPAKGSGLNPAFPASQKTRVKADGRKEVIEEKGFLTTEGVPVPLTQPRWRRWWVWTLGGATVVVALGWVVRRRARGRAVEVPLVEGG